MSGCSRRIQSCAPTRIHPEATLSGSYPRRDPKLGEVWRSEAEDAAPAQLLYEYEQACVYTVRRKRHRLSVWAASPECNESSRLGRCGAGGPDVPGLLTNPRKPRLIVTILRFRRHHRSDSHGRNIRLERSETHAPNLSARKVPPAVVSSSRQGFHRPPYISSWAFSHTFRCLIRSSI